METSESVSHNRKAETLTLYCNNSRSQEDYSESSTVGKRQKLQLESADRDDEKEDKSEKSTEFASLVAAHYNSIEKSDVEKRSVSRILYLRNFNNWVKSILIKDCASLLHEADNRNLKVLDMCCGKGGDLLKWARLNLEHLICADIAKNSLEECESRVKDLEQKRALKWNAKCEFIPADCTRVRLSEKYECRSIQLDIVSCQFSFHYCFESLPQAECMLRNASECLKVGGLFIGTIPNANEIVKRIKQSKTNCFKNDVCTIEMCCSEPYPLFGAKYNFYLEGVVDCPEFLVHFPTFERLAKKYSLQLVSRERFNDFFEKKRTSRDAEILLKRMKALETYPSSSTSKLVGPSCEYIHASVSGNEQQVGTLSKSEWEVASLYQTFVFRKVDVH